MVSFIPTSTSSSVTVVEPSAYRGINRRTAKCVGESWQTLCKAHDFPNSIAFKLHSQLRNSDIKKFLDLIIIHTRHQNFF